jgi:hypothetical protein
VNLDHPLPRLIGLATVLVCLALYDPAGAGALQRLLLPLLMALGAWALVQNLAAVALAVAVLGLIHLDLTTGDWIDRIAWPILTLAAIATLIAIMIRRFRARISETHAARWAERRDP